MIEEVAQQTTTTVTVSGSPLEVTIALWLSIFATVLSIVLGAHQVRLALRARSESRVARLDPILRDIYEKLCQEWSFGVPDALEILEDRIQKRGLRGALKKESPTLLDLLERLQVQERELGRTLMRLRELDGSLGGYSYRTSDGRITNYGESCWDRLVMRDKKRAALILPLIRDTKREMEKFFSKSS